MEFKTKKDMMLKAKTHNVYSLLAKPDSNPKVAKNGKVGVLTSPLHLAPANLSGYEVCPHSLNIGKDGQKSGCRQACLHTAGNPAYMAQKEKSRISRTKLYFENRPLFLAILKAEIELHIKRAEKENMFCAVRLNATSDIPWESVKFFGSKNIMEFYPNVKFYDYTKGFKRALNHAKGLFPKNYHLTYSLAEGNDVKASEILKYGGNVAGVFKNGLPAFYTLNGSNFPVIDGDVHDYRPEDPKGSIVGLKAKGKARKDNSGFARWHTQY